MQNEFRLEEVLFTASLFSPLGSRNSGRSPARSPARSPSRSPIFGRQPYLEGKTLDIQRFDILILLLTA